jgi:hypothetical protein
MILELFNKNIFLWLHISIPVVQPGMLVFYSYCIFYALTIILLHSTIIITIKTQKRHTD